MAIARSGSATMSPTSTPGSNPQNISVGAIPAGSRVIIAGDAIFTASDSRGNTYTQREVGPYMNFCDGLLTTAIQPGDGIALLRNGGNTMRYHISAWTGIDPVGSYVSRVDNFFQPNGPPSTVTSLDTFVNPIPREKSLVIQYFILVGLNGSSPSLTSVPSGYTNEVGVNTTNSVGVNAYGIDWMWKLCSRSEGNQWVTSTCSPAMDDGQFATVIYQPSQVFLGGL